MDKRAYKMGAVLKNLAEHQAKRQEFFDLVSGAMAPMEAELTTVEPYRDRAERGWKVTFEFKWHPFGPLILMQPIAEDQDMWGELALEKILDGVVLIERMLKRAKESGCF